MPTAVLTDHERTAVQAYLRLLHTVRAAYDAESGPPDTRRPPVVAPSALAEAETALARAGLSGNEETFFRMLRDWHPEP
ncbi:hypothetical protein DIZ27_22510 [Streptomyces sp. NWU339]|uniref:hypothetical protein n=1 Tax=Streptomyces sp. NWU339 TaxID=2185284 RepID=UPI000D682CE2|nr:hypothetical protein [Streptomyces sp. NWU339]PWI08447.1 hypothetical protein DIZ27_22510 [Streptomyces sp. NWU339]